MIISPAYFIESCNRVFPKGKTAQFAPFWYILIDQYGVNTVDRANMFLAQVGVECDEFTKFEEDLYYRADRLANVWPARFAKKDAVTGKYIKVGVKYIPNEKAFEYEKNPEKLANLVYGNRYGNGPASSGDGYRYRARGMKGVTFYANYAGYGASIGKKQEIISNPDLLLTPVHSIMSAGWFWKANKLNAPADLKNVKDATRIVNGGYNGLEKREKFYQILNG